eukprot:229613_1
MIIIIKIKKKESYLSSGGRSMDVDDIALSSQTPSRNSSNKNKMKNRNKNKNLNEMMQITSSSQSPPVPPQNPSTYNQQRMYNPNSHTISQIDISIMNAQNSPIIGTPSIILHGTPSFGNAIPVANYNIIASPHIHHQQQPQLHSLSHNKQPKIYRQNSAPTG